MCKYLSRSVECVEMVVSLSVKYSADIAQRVRFWWWCDLLTLIFLCDCGVYAFL